METIGALLVLLLTARLFGALSHRAGLPSAVGEMIAGMVLVLSAIVTGPHQPFVENLAHNEALAKVAELGIFFLVLMAGL